MPELPEVETIKNDLAPVLQGERIDKVDFLWYKTLRGMSAADFNNEVSGQHITRLSRRGKYLVLELESGKYLLVHFKMSGSFKIAGKDEEPPAHTRAVVHLKSGKQLFFIDPRKFGRFELIEAGQSPLQDLGVEPLSRSFTVKKLGEILSGRKTPVKMVLMDQRLIAGIGNMYADEALFLARIKPTRPAESLSDDEIEVLLNAIRTVLKQAIGRGGASIVNYFRPGGATGSAHFNFKVAHRKGNCPGCRGKIKRIVVRGRGTYYCPSCQR
jgi:formamidopyrimidine-DNA glycosylase